LSLASLTVAVVAIVINKTRLGALVRAAAFDRNMAASLALVSRVFALTFALVALGLAGVLLAPIYSVFPTMGRISSSPHSPL
jgi:branched-chain amino acid transport system permease protein